MILIQKLFKMNKRFSQPQHIIKRNLIEETETIEKTSHIEKIEEAMTEAIEKIDLTKKGTPTRKANIMKKRRKGMQLKKVEKRLKKSSKRNGTTREKIEETRKTLKREKKVMKIKSQHKRRKTLESHTKSS